MKGTARLIVFFSIFFLFVLCTSASAALVRRWVAASTALPVLSFALVPETYSAVQGSLPFTFFVSVLFGLSYSARRKIFAPMAMITLCALSTLFVVGAVQGFGALASAAGTKSIKPSALAEKGQIRSYGTGKAVLVGDADTDQPRWVIAEPDRPLSLKQLGPDAAGILSEDPFESNVPASLRGLMADFSREAAAFNALASEDPLRLAAYIAALAFLLTSLRFVLHATRWPLANLLVGALAFRWILSFDLFVGSPETTSFIARLSGGALPDGFAGSLVLAATALVLSLYGFLNFLAQDRSTRRAED